MMTKLSNPDYLTKARKLSEEEAERLLSRMSGKLPRRFQKNKLSREEALAIQLELEDEQLEEWRCMMQTLRKKEAEKQKTAQEATVRKSKSHAIDKAEEKSGAEKQGGTAAEPKASAKSRAGTKRKTAAKVKSVATTSKAEKSDVPE